MRVEGGRAEERKGGKHSVLGTRHWLQEVLRTVRQVAGMPDYQSYVEHLREHHPGYPIPTEREFFAEYTERRYGNGTSRCC